jgi:hypothetical protein
VDSELTRSRRDDFDATAEAGVIRESRQVGKSRHIALAVEEVEFFTQRCGELQPDVLILDLMALPGTRATRRPAFGRLATPPASGWARATVATTYARCEFMEGVPLKVAVRAAPSATPPPPWSSGIADT